MIVAFWWVGCGFFIGLFTVVILFTVSEFGWCVFLSLDAGCCGLVGFSISVACGVCARGLFGVICACCLVLVNASLRRLPWWLLVCFAW